MEEIVRYICEQYFNITHKKIDELRLQKLIYFSQKDVIRLTGKPLFTNKIYAWKYGPVCKRARKIFKEKTYHKVNKEINYELKYIISNVIKKYLKFSSWDLSLLSHKETAWIKARESDEDLIKLSDMYLDVKDYRVYDCNWDMYADEFEDLL